MLVPIHVKIDNKTVGRNKNYVSGRNSLKCGFI